MTNHICEVSGVEFKSKDGWIKCSDRLPPSWKNVLITDGNKIGFGYFKTEEGNIKHCNNQMLSTDKITHWMELPNLPKENEK